MRWKTPWTLWLVALGTLPSMGLADDAPFFLAVELKARRVARVGSEGEVVLPACTPLRPSAEATDRGKNVDLVNDHWGALRVRRADIESYPRAAGFAECVASAEAYAERYLDEHLAAFLERRLTVGMPAEWAILAFGPDFGGGRKEDSNRFEYVWRQRLLQGGCPGPPESVQSFALGELRGGPVIVGASLETGRITDLAIPSAPRKLAQTLAYDAGMALYRDGDASGALEAWLPLARLGHPQAAYSIADLYYRGDGVDRQLGEAVKWFRDAAERFYPPAMFHLGFLYVQGEGVERDLVEAYRWMALAAEFGYEKGEKGLELLEGRLTPEQLAAAKRSLASQEISSPELLHSVQPEYPELARVARLEGAMFLQAVIHEDGSVGDIEVVHVNLANIGFEDAAIEAVCQWRYEPARRAGKPVEVYFWIFVEFKLLAR